MVHELYLSKATNVTTYTWKSMPRHGFCVAEISEFNVFNFIPTFSCCGSNVIC